MNKYSLIEPKKIDWSIFINVHPNGNIFQSPEMYELFQGTKNYDPVIISAVDENGEIQGLLMAVIQKEHSGCLGKFSSRSIIEGGPLVKNNNFEVLDSLLKIYNTNVKGKAIYTQFRNLWVWSKEEIEIFEKNGFGYTDHLDIQVDLRKPVEELFLEIHSGRRKNIRRAEQVPLEFLEIKDFCEMELCLSLIEQTYKKINLPHPNKRYFLNAIKYLSKENGIKIFAAKYKGQIISCRFELCYKETVYDWYAGTDYNFLTKYPNDYLPWKIFEWAKMNGYTIFDFGGAGNPNKPYGVREYKIKFGGKLMNFGRFIFIHNKMLMLFGEIGLSIYRFLNQTKHHGIRKK